MKSAAQNHPTATADSPGQPSNVALFPRRWRWSVTILAGAVFWLVASRITVAWSERFYLIVPWIFVVQTIMVMMALGWRRSAKRWLVTVAGAAGLGAVYIYDSTHPEAGWPPLERTICIYGLCAVLIVSSWLWAITGQPIYARLVRPGQTRTGRGIAGRLAAILVYVVVLYPYLFAFLQTHWPKRIGPMSPHRLRLDTDDITWHSYDGTRLAGWFVRAGDSDRTAIVCHGVAADKSDMIDFVAALNRAGYNVLAFDFRGHGQSAGHTVSFGNYERYDIRSAIDMLCDRYPDRCKRLVGVGWSMGAASLILAAAEDDRIEALHVDAVYARTFDIARVMASHAPPVMRQLALYPGTAIASLESRTDLFTLAPVRAVPRIAPRPMMFVHGDKDAIIPIEQGRLVYEAALSPKSWHVVKGAGHCQTITIESPAYERRMVAFLDKALSRAQ